MTCLCKSPPPETYKTAAYIKCLDLWLDDECTRSECQLTQYVTVPVNQAGFYLNNSCPSLFTRYILYFLVYTQINMCLGVTGFCRRGSFVNTHSSLVTCFSFVNWPLTWIVCKIHYVLGCFLFTTNTIVCSEFLLSPRGESLSQTLHPMCTFHNPMHCKPHLMCLLWLLGINRSQFKLGRLSCLKKWPVCIPHTRVCVVGLRLADLFSSVIDFHFVPPW